MDELNWIRITSAAALVTGGALILAGKPRIGLAAAAAGATMAAIDQKEAVKKLWETLPQHIANLQQVLTHVQETVDEVAAQHEKLGRVLGSAARRL